MAPSDYIEARRTASSSKGDDDSGTRCIVDGEPYMPFLVVDPSNLESVKLVVAQLFQFDNHTDKSLSVKTVSGGITNALFCVSGLPSSGNSNAPESVLVRVFGAEGMIDRDVENATYASLGRAGIAPGYYGRFANGRVEEWIGDYHALDIHELQDPTISNAIAVQMALLHNGFVVPTHLQQYHNPSQPTLWTQLESWMEQALNSTFQTSEDTRRAQALNLRDIQHEITHLHNDVISKTAQVAFCHNDLLAANIMYAPDTHKIQLIDFEYGGINFCAFDIANHFNEFAGGTNVGHGPGLGGVPNYDWFPSQERQLEFVRAYVKTSKQQRKEFNSPAAPDLEVDALMAEVQAFVLVNHLYWGLWGVNQAAMEGCEEFDYMLYAKNRFAQYYKCKAEQEQASA